MAKLSMWKWKPRQEQKTCRSEEERQKRRVKEQEEKLRLLPLRPTPNLNRRLCSTSHTGAFRQRSAHGGAGKRLHVCSPSAAPTVESLANEWQVQSSFPLLHFPLRARAPKKKKHLKAEHRPQEQTPATERSPWVEAPQRGHAGFAVLRQETSRAPPVRAGAPEEERLLHTEGLDGWRDGGSDGWRDERTRFMSMCLL